MNNQQNAFFFETQQIPDDTIIFDEFKKQTIFFSYFQVDQKYYLFFYRQKFIDIDLIDPFINILQELDIKQRKIRSLSRMRSKGFFLYALEIMEFEDLKTCLQTSNGKDLKILTTNLQPSFWRKIKTILRQNKKAVLLEFLFRNTEGKGDGSLDLHTQVKILEDQIDKIQNKLNYLQERIIHLENKNIEMEAHLNVLLEAQNIRFKRGSEQGKGEKKSLFAPK